MSNVKELSLKKNFSWNFIGSLAYSLSQFLVLVILAKMGNPEMVGIYSIGLAITAPIIMLTNLQLRQVQATDTTNEYVFNDYFGLRIIMGFITIIVTVVIVIMNDYNFNKSLIIILVGLTKIIDSYSDVVYGHLQQCERMDYIGKSRIIKAVVTLVVIVAALFTINSLLVALISLNISWLVIFWAYDKEKIKLFNENVKPVFNYKKFKNLIILTFPLGIVLMFGSLGTNIPRIMVGNYLGDVSLGYFAAIAYLMVAGNMFVSAVGQAAAPRLAKLYKSNSLKKYKRLLLQLTLLGLLLGVTGIIIALFLGEQILSIVFDNTYADYSELLVLIVIAGAINFSGSFLGYALTSMRLFKIQPYLGLVWMLVSLIASLILIPTIGLKGGAYTLILTSICQFALMLLVILINLRLRSRKSKVN